MEVFSELRKIRHSLASEITVFVCGAIVLLLNFYLFNDLVNEELSKISASVQSQILHGAAWALCLFFSAHLAKFILDHSSTHVLKYLDFLGEDRSFLKRYYYITRIGFIIFIIWKTHFFINTFLVEWSFAHYLIRLMVTIAIACIVFVGVKKLKINYQVPNNQPISKVQWRLKQIFTRNRLAILCLCLAALFLLFAFISWFRGTPIALYYGFSWITGFFLSAALASQLAVDLRHAWLEKNSGQSHQMILQSYQKIGFILALPVCLLFLLVLLIQAEHSVTDIAKFVAPLLGPCFLFPALAFQVDAKRPILQMLVLFIVTLFLNTAVFAYWFALVLYPIAYHYCAIQQEGRFYRA